ncbi:hypothetical protein [Nodularia spumigena]|jgi:hypothetical protein|uniref:hypothetical protein n=1 Tax=Nodularia spumigena TaxID=70799 RepID=UPI00232CE3E1|nr:hypothetical protein [Nodularia spumigena]MDB9500041.1 hypothetical protein [Nodularia spumigena CS-336/02]
MKTHSILLNADQLEAFKNECASFIDRMQRQPGSMLTQLMTSALMLEVLKKLHTKSFTPKKNNRITVTQAQAIAIILAFGQRTGYKYEITVTNNITSELGKKI